MDTLTGHQLNTSVQSGHIINSANTRLKPKQFNNLTIVPVSGPQIAIQLASEKTTHGIGEGSEIEPGIRKTNHLLIEAVQRGTAETVITLIDMGADVNAKMSDGRTPLMFAAVTGSPEIVEILLNAGADVDAQALDGSTALIKACLWGHTGIVEILIDYGADPEIESDDGWTPLSVALQQGQQDIARLLKTGGAKDG